MITDTHNITLRKSYDQTKMTDNHSGFHSNKRPLVASNTNNLSQKNYLQKKMTHIQ